MIASLRGVVTERGADRLVIEVGGVGYEVFVSNATLAVLPADGSETRLEIHTHAVKDGGLQLFAFATAQERTTFRLLIGVQGVGPRVALQMLSGLAPEDLWAAIRRGEVARLSTVRGIGKKTAQRLVTELRDKVPASVGETAPVPTPPAAPGSLTDRVAQALEGLGYRAVAAERAAHAAAEHLPQGSLEELVREALRHAEGGR